MHVTDLPSHVIHVFYARQAFTAKHLRLAEPQPQTASHACKKSTTANSPTTSPRTKSQPPFYSLSPPPFDSPIRVCARVSQKPLRLGVKVRLTHSRVLKRPEIHHVLPPTSRSQLNTLITSISSRATSTICDTSSSRLQCLSTTWRHHGGSLSLFIWRLCAPSRSISSSYTTSI